MNKQDIYWVGKSPIVRQATEEYIWSLQSGKRLTFAELATKFSISPPAINRHVLKLRTLGIYGLIPKSKRDYKKVGRPKGSGLGKYKGKKAKTPASIRRAWRDYYHKNKRKKKERLPKESVELILQACFETKGE